MTDENGSPWVPGSAEEAAGVMESCVRYLAGQDYTGAPTEVLAGVIAAMEKVDAGQSAVRAKTVAEFTRQHGYEQDAHRGMRTWLVNQTGADIGSAAAHTAQAKRGEKHPVLLQALSDVSRMTDGVAKKISGWTGKLPDEHVDAADEILATAFADGATVADLADLAAQIAAEVAPPSEDEGKEPGRSVRIERTFEGAGVLTGDLDPACAAVVQAALDLYGRKRGKDDDRSVGERHHDALAQICQDALAGRADSLDSDGKTKRRGGKAGAALVHISLADVTRLAGYGEACEEWKRDVYAQWAGQNARNSIQHGDGGTWLSGDQALGLLPDCKLTPVVTGHIDRDAIPRLAENGHRLHTLLKGDDGSQETERQKEHLVRDLLGEVIAVLSGPSGYASYVRGRLFEGSALGGRSLPLDVGTAKDFPPQIRKALNIRDRGCAWAGGCDQPAMWTEPHHVIFRQRGGRTALINGAQLCWWHHHVVIHQRGWTATLNPDGTLTVGRPG